MDDNFVEDLASGGEVDVSGEISEDGCFPAFECGRFGTFFLIWIFGGGGF